MKYADTVTPSDKQRRQCILPAHNYLTDGRPVFGEMIKPKYYPEIVPSYPFNEIGLKKADDRLKRFVRVSPLEKINRSLVTTVYARIVPDSDKSAYRRDHIGLRQGYATNRYPPRLYRDHPNRPYKTERAVPFTLSRKYWFDN